MTGRRYREAGRDATTATPVATFRASDSQKIWTYVSGYLALMLVGDACDLFHDMKALAPPDPGDGVSSIDVKQDHNLIMRGDAS